MSPSPERPFVPRRTPTKAQPAIASADFTLSRPFVPGAERERIGSYSLETSPEPSMAPSTAVPPIESFLEEDELPPVEHFIDPLPAVEDFAADREVGVDRERDEYSVADARVDETAATEWIETDWQQYDWRAAAALGDTGDNEASTAWASTDWDAGMPRTRETNPTQAQAIASALDQIAQRIRDGKLALPAPGTVTDPRSIAATLAALLGIRQ